MNARQQKVLARFGQVLTFLDANTTSIPPSAVAGQRQSLLGAITQITGFVQDQVVKGAEALTAQTLSSARTALRDTYMRQLSAVGLNSLTGKHAGDANVPNGTQIFALPTTRTNALTLIASATAMVKAATPYSSIFAAHGVSLDAATGAIQAVESAVTAEGSAKRVSKGATQGIKEQIDAGHAAVRLMDVVVRPLVAGNKALLTQWESVKRAAGGHNLAVPVPLPVTTQAASATAGTTTAGSVVAAAPASASSTSSTTSQPTQAKTAASTTASTPASAPAGTSASTPAPAVSSAPATATAAPSTPSAPPA